MKEFNAIKVPGLLKKTIRCYIAGRETNTTIAISNGWALTHTVIYKGWFEEAFAVNTFKIYHVTHGSFFYSFESLQMALNAWDEITFRSPTERIAKFC